MTIANKLEKIAQNSRALYDAGYKAGHIKGLTVSTVGFTDWHTSTVAGDLQKFKHGFKTKPSFVAFIPNDITALERVEPPDKINSVICQADATYNPETDTYCPANFIRFREGAFSSSARLPDDGSNRLIAGWDNEFIYVNANGSAEAWPPASVTTFTLICCTDIEASNVIFGIKAGEVVENSIMKMQAIEFSFDDWFTSESETYYIYHSLGTDPDTVVILPSHHDWNNANDYDGYFETNVVAGLKRSWYANQGGYSDVSVDYFDSSNDGYFSKTTSDPIIDWSANSWVGIHPTSSVVFAPKDEVTYKMLIIKHIL